MNIKEESMATPLYQHLVDCKGGFLFIRRVSLKFINKNLEGYCYE